MWGSVSYGARIIVDGTRITVADKDHCGERISLGEKKFVGVRIIWGKDH